MTLTTQNRAQFQILILDARKEFLVLMNVAKILKKREATLIRVRKTTKTKQTSNTQ